MTYDTTNGNVTSRTDFNQHKICYAYASQGRNLETARVEGLGSGDACTTALAAPTLSGDTRKISTQWHTYWRLPVKVAEPKRLTTWVYNGDTYQSATVSCAPPTALIGTQPIGVLCKKIIQATTDSSGVKGLSATIDSNIASRIWSYIYDGNGQALTVDGPRPHTDVDDITSYTYYSTDDSTAPIPKFRHGDLQSITDALGHVTQITSYDGNGRPLTIIDPNIVTITLTYWPRGWLKSKSVGSKTTNYIYDNVGNLTQVTLANGSFISYTYDAAHRLTDISDARLNRVHYTLDAIGNRTLEEVFDANSVLSTKKGRDFDALNRLWHDIAFFNDPATQIKTEYAYDPNGNLTKSTDPLNNITSFSYDALNRLLWIVDPINTLKPTTYGYDGIDQLKSVTDPRTLATAYTVNALGDATQQASPDSGATNRTFDEAGNLKTATDARSIQATYNYDALNRLTAISYPSTGENIAYTWDTGAGCTYGVERLCQVTDAVGSTAYAYDDQGNLTQTTRTEAGISLTTQYAYDGANRLISEITPTGETLSLVRDTTGRINTVSTTKNGATTLLAKDIAYNGAGQVTAQTLGNGVKQAASFDLSGQPAIQRFNSPDGDLNGDGVVDVADVALAERMALGLITPTADQLVHGDIAPASAPDGIIDAADVAQIRRKALGL